MGGMKRYPAYKDSGVDWLGDIPKNWEVKKLKFVARLTYGEPLTAETRDIGGIDVYGSNGIVGKHSKANTLAPAIIVGRKGSFGKVQYSFYPCFCIDTAYFINSRTTKQNIKWLYYALQSLELDKISQDTGVPGLSREDAHEKIIAVPLPYEQEAIAQAEKEIELIQEYQTTLISDAVTGKIDVRDTLEIGTTVVAGGI